MRGVLCFVSIGLLVGCGEPLVSPELQPHFLIQSAPTMLLDGAKPAVEVTALVSKGLTQVAQEDRFRLRTTVDFSGVGSLGPVESSPSAAVDEGVRGGGHVAVSIVLDIPYGLWKSLAAIGDIVPTQATVELIMTDGSGSDHVLDSEVSSAGLGPFRWEILVSEVSTSTVRRVSSDGMISAVFHQARAPRGLAVEADGSIVVVQLGGALRRISSDGAASYEFFSGLSGASGITVMPNGDLVVTEDGSPYRITRIAPDGSASAEIARGIRSEDIDLDADGNLIVLQEIGGALLRVTPAGDVATIRGGFSAPAAVFVESDGNILVAEYGASRVVRVSPDGSTVTVVASGLSGVEEVFVTPTGDILVSELPARRISKVNLDASVSPFAQGLSGPDQMTIRPIG